MRSSWILKPFTEPPNPAPNLALRPGVDDVADSAWVQALPELTVVRGSEDPLAASRPTGLGRAIQTGAARKFCKAQEAKSYETRTLVLAGSDGRRESLLDFLRASGLQPPAFDNLAEFMAGDRRAHRHCHLVTHPDCLVEEAIDFVTRTELFATAPTTRRRKQEQVSDVEALIKDPMSELNVGDPVVHSAHGIGRYQGPWSTWTWAAKCQASTPAPLGFCTWNTPTTPPCTCP